jgi:Fe2+ transport system protein FeoA
LYSADKNNVYQVMSVPEIGLLKNLGVRAGTKVAIQQKYALGGPVLLNIEDSFLVAIGKDIATKITVGKMP